MYLVSTCLKRKKTWNSRLYCCYISVVFNTCSSSMHVPILSFGIGLCSFVLFSDNVSRNSCICNLLFFFYVVLFLRSKQVNRKKDIKPFFSLYISNMRYFIILSSGACWCTIGKQTVFTIMTRAVLTTHQLQDLLQEMCNLFCMVRVKYQYRW